MVVFIIALVTSPVALAEECRLVVNECEAYVGDTIQIPILVEGGLDIGALDLNITFDPSLLSAESADDGELDNTVINLEDAGSGKIKVVAFQGGNNGINGNFTVCNITFKALETGVSSIDLEVVTLTDASPQCENLSYTVQDGAVTIYREESDHSSVNPVGGGGGSSEGGWWYTTPTPTLTATPAAIVDGVGESMRFDYLMPTQTAVEDGFGEEVPTIPQLSWSVVLIVIGLILAGLFGVVYLRRK